MSVYLKAAKLIAENKDEWMRTTNNDMVPLGWKTRACCAALGQAAGDSKENYYAVAAFEEMFYRRTNSGYYWTEPSPDRPKSWRDQQARILALLFMHWMTEGK